MRKIIPFNNNWNFTKDNINWESVTLPHTWNAVDGMDGKGEYYRGQCCYLNQLATPKLQDGQRVCLEILALSLSGKVFVNDKEVGRHEGGYSSFTVDITDFLHPCTDESGLSVEAAPNTVTILADNTPHSNIYPQMADFTFYGGLYRGVNILILSRTHFEVGFHGASGLAITPEIIDAENLTSRSQTTDHNVCPSCCFSGSMSPKAMIHLNSWITEPTPDYTVYYRITDGDGCLVAEAWRPSEDPKADILLSHPHLWQGVEDPYLYTCTAALVYRNETVDEISSRFGIRSFYVDPEKGFFLNGKPMMLRGVSRHQDRLYLGNALTRQQHYEDAALIHEIGANTVRLAHYQHSRDFYDACDEYGFIVWAEIPYISCQSDDPAAHENCRLQMEDLIYQNYNHPSICFWGISNEITIAGEKPGLVENHKDLNALVKKIDPSRLTTVAHVTMLSPDSELHGITDVESYNHYFGWYGGTYDNNEKWLDHFHSIHPEICLGLSEYGAEGIITYQPDEPKCRDYSEAYQAEYHEHMAKILMERPYLWSTHVWNMFDFGCAARNEGGTAGRNNKGLVTMDRKIRKEAFYVYKAYWSREPFVHLCGRRYAKRTGDTTTVKVYSNLSHVTLYVNGEAFATKYCDKIFVFENVPMSDGFTYLTAEAGSAPACADAWLFLPHSPVTDTITLEKVEKKPEIYTLPQEEDDGDGVANWFETVETVASDAPMEYSDKHFSVYDKINTISANEEAFRILSNAMYSMTGMRMKKSMLAMMGEKTFFDLSGMLSGMAGSDSAQKIPENALQIINSELSKVKK
jgi:beta-galactosidase